MWLLVACAVTPWSLHFPFGILIRIFRFVLVVRKATIIRFPTGNLDALATPQKLYQIQIDAEEKS